MALQFKALIQGNASSPLLAACLLLPAAVPAGSPALQCRGASSALLAFPRSSDPALQSMTALRCCKGSLQRKQSANYREDAPCAEHSNLGGRSLPTPGTLSPADDSTVWSAPAKTAANAWLAASTHITHSPDSYQGPCSLCFTAFVIPLLRLPLAPSPVWQNCELHTCCVRRKALPCCAQLHPSRLCGSGFSHHHTSIRTVTASWTDRQVLELSSAIPL